MIVGGQTRATQLLQNRGGRLSVLIGKSLVPINDGSLKDYCAPSIMSSLFWSMATKMGEHSPTFVKICGN